MAKPRRTRQGRDRNVSFFLDLFRSKQHCKKYQEIKQEKVNCMGKFRARKTHCASFRQATQDCKPARRMLVRKPQLSQVVQLPALPLVLPSSDSTKRWCHLASRASASPQTDWTEKPSDQTSKESTEGLRTPFPKNSMVTKEGIHCNDLGGHSKEKSEPINAPFVSFCWAMIQFFRSKFGSEVLRPCSRTCSLATMAEPP